MNSEQQPSGIAVAAASVLACVGLILLSQRWPEFINDCKIAALTVLEVLR